MICDRKFMLYDYYSDFACQVEEHDAQIKEEQEVMRAKNLEFKQVKRQILELRSKLEEQKVSA